MYLFFLIDFIICKIYFYSILHLNDMSLCTMHPYTLMADGTYGSQYSKSRLALPAPHDASWYSDRPTLEANSVPICVFLEYIGDGELLAGRGSGHVRRRLQLGVT